MKLTRGRLIQFCLKIVRGDALEPNEINQIKTLPLADNFIISEAVRKNAERLRKLAHDIGVKHHSGSELSEEDFFNLEFHLLCNLCGNDNEYRRAYEQRLSRERIHREQIEQRSALSSTSSTPRQTPSPISTASSDNESTSSQEILAKLNRMERAKAKPRRQRRRRVQADAGNSPESSRSSVSIDSQNVESFEYSQNPLLRLIQEFYCQKYPQKTRDEINDYVKHFTNHINTFLFGLHERFQQYNHDDDIEYSFLNSVIEFHQQEFVMKSRSRDIINEIDLETLKDLDGIVNQKDAHNIILYLRRFFVDESFKIIFVHYFNEFIQKQYEAIEQEDVLQPEYLENPLEVLIKRYCDKNLDVSFENFYAYYRCELITYMLPRMTRDPYASPEMYQRDIKFEKTINPYIRILDFIEIMPRERNMSLAQLADRLSYEEKYKFASTLQSILYNEADPITKETSLMVKAQNFDNFMQYLNDQKNVYLSKKPQIVDINPMPT